MPADGAPETSGHEETTDKYTTWPLSGGPPRVALTYLTRGKVAVFVLLVIYWLEMFQGGLSWNLLPEALPDSSKVKTDKMFNVHILAMTLAFALVSEAVISYRANVAGAGVQRQRRKMTHAILQVRPDEPSPKKQLPLCESPGHPSRTLPQQLSHTGHPHLHPHWHLSVTGAFTHSSSSPPALFDCIPGGGLPPGHRGPRHGLRVPPAPRACHRLALLHALVGGPHLRRAGGRQLWTGDVGVLVASAVAALAGGPPAGPQVETWVLCMFY